MKTLLAALSPTDSSDDMTIGFGKFYKHQILQTDTRIYEILESLGRGIFGEAVLARMHPTKRHVVLKILNHQNCTHKKAVKEVSILNKIRSTRGCLYYIVQFYTAYIYKNQYCLVFEALDKTLSSFMEQRACEPLELIQIKLILQQILSALHKLKELQIIHSDLKLDNIMFVNMAVSCYRIKIIDFGNALMVNETPQYKVIQSLCYRAPEVILGAPYSHPVDVWSVGCIAAALYLGHTLYKGDTPYDQIRLMYKTEKFSEQILDDGEYTKKYFNKCHSSRWTLKTPAEYHTESGKTSKDRSKYSFSSLNALVYFGVYRYGKVTPVSEQRYAFVDLLKQMLALTPTSRITPEAALQHNFINNSKRHF